MPPERTERRPLGRLPARIVGRQVGEDTLLSLGLFNQIGETAMTSDMEIAFNEQGIPNTFVPGRNLVFLTAAAALAWRKGIRHLVMGVCETDFSGYPDCRDDTVKAMQVALNLGMDARFVVHTPLMCWTRPAHGPSPSRKAARLLWSVSVP